MCGVFWGDLVGERDFEVEIFGLLDWKWRYMTENAMYLTLEFPSPRRRSLAKTLDII